jgi:hypothetical protein
VTTYVLVTAITGTPVVSALTDHTALVIGATPASSSKINFTALNTLDNDDAASVAFGLRST